MKWILSSRPFETNNLTRNQKKRKCKGKERNRKERNGKERSRKQRGKSIIKQDSIFISRTLKT
jgi:hypothetical protein